MSRTSHIRSESDTVLESIGEVLDIARDTGVAVQLSHLKSMYKRNWKKLPLIFDLIEKALDEGLDVTADRYPYTAASTGLDAVLPP